MVYYIENTSWKGLFWLCLVLHDRHKWFLNIFLKTVKRVFILCIISNILSHTLLQLRPDSLFNLIILLLKLQHRPITQKPTFLWLNQPIMLMWQNLQLPIIPSNSIILLIILQVIIIRPVPNIKGKLYSHLNRLLTT